LSILKCPDCGDEMEEGFVSISRPVVIEWVKGVDGPMEGRMGDRKLLMYEFEYRMKPIYRKAYLCRMCELVLFCYPRIPGKKESKTALEMIHSEKRKM
jgi:hypothetical protein